jgi:hypothetical protein
MPGRLKRPDSARILIPIHYPDAAQAVNFNLNIFRPRTVNCFICFVALGC